MKPTIAILLLAALLSGCKEQAPESAAPQAAKAPEAAPLTRYEVAGLEVMLPGPPVHKPAELPERSLLKSMDNYELYQGTTKIMLSHMVFMFSTPGLDDTADRSIEAVKADPNATMATSSKDNVVVDGIDARKIRIDLKQSGHPVTMHALVFIRKNQIWHLQIIAQDGIDLDALDKLQESIFSSIKLQAQD